MQTSKKSSFTWKDSVEVYHDTCLIADCVDHLYAEGYLQWPMYDGEDPTMFRQIFKGLLECMPHHLVGMTITNHPDVLGKIVTYTAKLRPEFTT
tara:strand:- start:174 stop:455 length:282 start_codon:yes stop_codon:yes gene_type:complete